MDLRAHRNESTGRWALEGVEPSEVTFERMCKMLREGENFKFARYGDGEANCMLGKVGHNCDGHEYFPDLGTALNDAFYSDPKYMVGIQPLMVQQGTWQKLIQREGYPKNIYDADALHSASIDGRFEEMFRALAPRRTVMVGPSHLIGVANKFIRIPDKNCWNEYSAINELMHHAHQEDVVYILCASMMSEVLISNFQHFDDCTIIDFGSVLDPFFGKLSRRYHHKLQLNGH